MKRLALASLLALSLVALAAAQAAPPSPLQTALSRLGGTYSFDLAKDAKGHLAVKATPILTYRTATYDNVLPDVLKGRMRLNLDLSALVGAKGDGAAMGLGLLANSTAHLRATGSTSFDVTGTLGLSFLYGTDGGKARLGLVAGVGFKF